MNKLENRIRNERGAFDSFEPSNGHMERFAMKLGKQPVSLISGIPYIVRVAALVFLVAASSLLVYEQITQRSRGSLSNADIRMKELSDARFYFTSLIQEKYDAIDRFTRSDPEQNHILMKELGSMDRMLKSLQEDLLTYPADERVIHAMISHYELKLEVMSQIIKQLENVKQATNNNTYENIET